MNPLSVAVGLLGKALAGMAQAVVKPIVSALSPISLVNNALAQTGSGLGVFQSAVQLLGSTLAPLLLPVFVGLAAAVVAASDYIWDKLLPVLGDWYNWIFGTAIPAIKSFCDALSDGAAEIGMGIAKALGVEVATDKAVDIKLDRDPAVIAQKRAEQDERNKQNFARQLEKPGEIYYDWGKDLLKGKSAPEELRVAAPNEDAAGKAAREAALKKWLTDAYNKQVDDSAAARTAGAIKAQAGTDTAAGKRRRAELEKRLEDPAEMEKARKEYGPALAKPPADLQAPAGPETDEAKAAREKKLRAWTADRIEVAGGLRDPDRRYDAGAGGFGGGGSGGGLGGFSAALGMAMRDLRREAGPKAAYSGLSQVNQAGQLAALNTTETEAQSRLRFFQALENFERILANIDRNTEKQPATFR